MPDSAWSLLYDEDVIDEVFVQVARDLELSEPALRDAFKSWVREPRPMAAAIPDELCYGCYAVAHLATWRCKAQMLASQLSLTAEADARTVLPDHERLTGTAMRELAQRDLAAYVAMAEDFFPLLGISWELAAFHVRRFVSRRDPAPDDASAYQRGVVDGFLLGVHTIFDVADVTEDDGVT